MDKQGVNKPKFFHNQKNNFCFNLTAIFFLLAIFLLVLMPITSATVLVGNKSHSIEKKYGASQNIIGWINISLNNENASSILRDSLGNEISVLNLLKQNPNVNYSCLPKDCRDDYSASNGVTEKIISGISSGVQNYGMLFSGSIISINSVAFDVSSSTPVAASCSSQLEIDFLNDGTAEFSNSNIGSEICPGTKSYGCFDTNLPSELYTIESQPYCQKINLTKAPGFRIGAWIKKESGSKEIIASIYDKDGYEIENGNCRLPDASSSGGEVYCDINYLVKKPESYYVCIQANPGIGEYKIKGYSTQNGCGFWNYPPSSENAAYSIFAEAKKFGSFSSMNVRNLLDTGEDLAYMSENYIRSKYGNLNCVNGCVVPIKFTINQTGSNSDFNIRNIKIDYEKTSGIVSGNTLYDVVNSPAKINSGFGKLYLDNSGLKVRNSLGSFSYILRIGSQVILSETLSVERTPVIKGLSPLKTAYAFPTKFDLVIESGRNATPIENISHYLWNFGDNTTIVTTVPRAIHTYNSSGLYNLQVLIKDFNNISSSRTFTINVTSPKFLIDSAIKNMKTDLTNVKNQINNFGIFERASLENATRINELNQTLATIERTYKNADESDYQDIVSEILALKIPEAVMASKTTNNYVFFPERNEIDIDVLKDIDSESTSRSNSAYKDAVYSWNSQNIETKLDYKEISARYFEISEPILHVFTFKIREKAELDYRPYLIIREMENLKFERNYDLKESDGYKYIELTPGVNEITFSTTENVSFESVPVFVAPPLNKLSLVEEENEKFEEAEQKFPLKPFIISISILFAVSIILYIFLQIWYKKRYEDYLFKNKNDLYNLLHFINLERKKRATDKEIHSKLKHVGWSSEQINYALKKSSGKKTGMFEVPIGKLFKSFKEKT